MSQVRIYRAALSELPDHYKLLTESFWVEQSIDGLKFPISPKRTEGYIRAFLEQLYAKEIDAAGGRGEFLRAEASRWANDLQERYPTSKWASKARSK